MPTTRPTPLLLLVPALSLACSTKTFQLTCDESDGRYSLVMPNGNTRSGTLGCRAAYQQSTPRKSQRRLLVRLDTGSGVVADSTGDTGAADSGGDSGGAGTTEDWSGTDGVMLGFAWSRGTNLLGKRVPVGSWLGGIPETDGELQAAAGSFASAAELPETAVLAAFVTPTNPAELSPRRFESDSSNGGFVDATGYVYAKADGDQPLLQVIIEDLELEEGAVLSLEATMRFTATEVKDQGGG